MVDLFDFQIGSVLVCYVSASLIDDSLIFYYFNENRRFGRRFLIDFFICVELGLQNSALAPCKSVMRGIKVPKRVVLSMQECYTWKEGVKVCCTFHARALFVERRCQNELSIPCKSVIREKKVSQ